MGGVSVTILELEEDCFLTTENQEFPVKIEKQSDFHDVDGIEMASLSDNTRTIVKQESDTDSMRKLSVEMSSKKKNQPIYIHEQGIKRYNQGYQEIRDFQVWVEKESNKIFVFAAKDTASTFAKRLRRNQDIDTSRPDFDFSRLQELEKLDSYWGRWKDNKGRIQRIGEFGDLEEVMDDPESITTIYIDYEYATEIIQLTLSEGASISTRQNLNKADMLEVYDEMKNIIIE